MQEPAAQYSLKCVNLGCGPVFCSDPEWINLDYVPADPSIIQANLLQALPFATDSIDVVYSSHFLEHIPRNCVPSFLDECFRVLKPGGLLRLVLPDLEEMARSYLCYRSMGLHEKADFVVIQIIDQAVRRRPGGELGELYAKLLSNVSQSEEMIEFIRARNGESFGMVANSDVRKGLGLSRGQTDRKSGSVFSRLNLLYSRVRRRLYSTRIKIGCRILPRDFVSQNVSFADLGEKHYWLWDLSQLSAVLSVAGFVDVGRMSASTSKYSAFPFRALDLGPNGEPRKGEESMYVECLKPKI